jgi:hypothetical protein
MRSLWKIPFYNLPVGRFLSSKGCPWAFQVHPTRRVHLYTGKAWQNTRIRQPMLKAHLSLYIQSRITRRAIRAKFARIAQQAARRATPKKTVSKKK